MNTVLVYKNRKTDPIVFDASTPELRAKAFLNLFRLIQDWNCYDDIEGNYMVGSPDLQKRLYKLAILGNSHAAEQLVTLRKDWGYEYEHWNEVRVES